MKNMLLLLAFFTITISNAQKTLTFKSAVSEKDYEQMDATDRKISDFVDASVAALKAINLNQVQKQQKSAIISLSLKGGALDNNVMIANSEPQPTSAQSCKICGVGSGMMCYRKMRTQLENGTVIVTVELVGDCVQISW